MFFSTSAGEADRILPWVITIKIKVRMIEIHAKKTLTEFPR
jgi:hypothetical protein